MTFISRNKFISLTSAAAFALSGLLATTTLGAAQEAKMSPTITVSADGEVSAKPDMAIINLGVVTDGKTADEALAANNDAMAKVMAGIKKTGIEERDLQTSSFSIYQASESKTSSKGVTTDKTNYRVSNSLTISERDLTKLGALLDETVKLGINSSRNLMLTNAEPKPYITEARKKAVIEARERAETLALAAGVKLGRILQINEGGARFAPVEQRAMMAADSVLARSSVPVATGEIQYSVNVTVTFEIE